jgi:hypothetical protein
MNNSQESYYKTLLQITVGLDLALKAKNPLPIIEGAYRVAVKGLDSYQYRKLLEDLPKNI